MKFLHFQVYNPDPLNNYLLYYKGAFDAQRNWHGGFRPLHVREFDAEDTEVAEIEYQAKQLGLAVDFSPCPGDGS